MKIAVEKGRSAGPTSSSASAANTVAIRTVKFCHHLGLTYVSCSPFRVPVARLAAAQAALEAAASRTGKKSKQVSAHSRSRWPGSFVFAPGQLARASLFLRDRVRFVRSRRPGGYFSGRIRSSYFVSSWHLACCFRARSQRGRGVPKPPGPGRGPVIKPLKPGIYLADNR